MKRSLLPTLMVAAFTHATVMAQVQQQHPSNSDRAALRTTHADPRDGSRGGGPSPIWSEDFGNGFPAGWTVQDGSGICPWRWSLDGSYGFYSGGTATTSGDTIASTTASNGFLICDNDSANNTAYGQPSGTTYQYLSSYFTTTAIDLSGHPSVRLEFEQFFRYNNAPTLDVMVSTDSVNWTTFNVVGNVEPNTASDNADLAMVNISGVAGDQPQVYLKIGWNSRVYFWQIDDMRIVDAPANDLSVIAGFIGAVRTSYDDYDATNLEYSFMALEQATPMTFGVHVVNNGSATQTNIVVSATINGNTLTSSPFGPLAAGMSDTLLFQSSFTPSATGAYTATLAVSSDLEDATPEDNQIDRSWEVTDPTHLNSEMGLDGNNLTNITNLSTGTDYSELGSKFEVQNEGSFAYGVGVFLANGTKVGASFSVELLEDTPDGLTSVATSDQVTVTQEMLNGSGGAAMMYVPFDAVLSDPAVIPAPLDPAKDYIAFIKASGPDTIVIGQSGTTGKGGLWSFDNADQQYVQYIGAGNKAAMVRLFLSPYTGPMIGINEVSARTGMTLSPNIPDPFSTSTLIYYTLAHTGPVLINVYDVTGALVRSEQQGTMSAGAHAVELDGSSLSQGLYTYTLISGNERLSQRMVVIK